MTLTLLIAISFTMCACSHDNTELEDKEEIKHDASESESNENGTNNNNKEENMEINSANFPLSEGKNGQAPTIRLSSGYDMPIVGLGTYSLMGDVCVNSVK